MMARLFPEQQWAPGELAKCDDKKARQMLGSLAVGVSIFRANLAKTAHLLKDAYQAKTDAEKAAAAHLLQTGMKAVSDTAMMLQHQLVDYDRWAPYFGIRCWGDLMAERSSLGRRLTPYDRTQRLLNIVRQDARNVLAAEVQEDGTLKQLNPAAIEEHKKLTSGES